MLNRMLRIPGQRPGPVMLLSLTLAALPAAFAQTGDGPLTVSLQDALARAKANAPQLLSANISAQLAKEDTVQARAALLPGVSTLNQFIYTQPNGTGSGVFVANDGPRIYNNQLVVHGDLFGLGKIADWERQPPQQFEPARGRRVFERLDSGPSSDT